MSSKGCWGLGVVALLCAGCGGTGFDSPSMVTTLRALAVQKDVPYARPGEDVTTSLLWHDPAAPRDVEVRWFAGCTNPPADLFSLCAEGLDEEFFDNLDVVEDLGFTGTGDTFTYQIEDDALEGREPRSPGDPVRGVSFVFFTLCPGSLRYAPEREVFPAACIGPDGNEVDSDDFVVGYTTIAIYDDVRNENPPITGLELDGQLLEEMPGRVLDVCTEEKASDCPKLELNPLVDTGVASEIDPLTGDPEQVWITYFATSGEFSPEGRLVSDPDTGTNDDITTKFRIPQEPGVHRLWAILQDGRGGADWATGVVEVR